MASDTDYQIVLTMFAGWMCAKFPELGKRTEAQIIACVDEFLNTVLKGKS